MPGFAKRNEQSTNGNYSVEANGFWSKARDDVSYSQLQKFWSELSPQSRQKLLRIEKQSLFEQARKNMYCSRCNGLLLESFLQIVMYGKNLQQGRGEHTHSTRCVSSTNRTDGVVWNTSDCSHEEIQDPSVHPWGGLTVTRDGSLTILDCYLNSKTLKGLQNVFESARGRERERELLYPDACGGGARGWISQGVVSYARVHATRESCALHTATLSCDTLVNFWSELGEEIRLSLSRMKEEDFIERLMHRFDSKRFCRDCRRNVIREFKELKELKRMRRETRCTNHFCGADTAFQYEVSNDTIEADWCQTFADNMGMYHHFEWAVGTVEGKSDILGYENVGTNGSVKVSGLNLGGLSACFITLRAWKLDGRCTEICVKAHALKGQQCLHCRLVVGDGLVTITRGESIRKFFEHAEEAEEEEDDDSIDKDVNDLDGECSRPQRHAKSPELAREFLLDAATVIFKEQVEKTYREGIARQNSHSMFVCLALKLLEERVHVACKEIITLEKQMKLLEEEENEKREEEERRERKRTKEREKKIRRKERLRGKEKEKANQCPELVDTDVSDISCPLQVEPSDIANEELISAITLESSLSDLVDNSQSISVENLEDNRSNGYATLALNTCCGLDGEVNSTNGKLKQRKDFQFNPSMRWSERRRCIVTTVNEEATNKSVSRHYSDDFDSSKSFGTKNRNGRLNGRLKFHCVNHKVHDSYSCSCQQHREYTVKTEPHVSEVRVRKETRFACSLDNPKQFYRPSKYGQFDYVHDTSGRSKSKHLFVNNSFGKDLPLSKKVWEPTDSWKKYPRSSSDSDVSLKLLNSKVTDPIDSCGFSKNEDIDLEILDGKDFRIGQEISESDSLVEAKTTCLSLDIEIKNCVSSMLSDSGIDTTSISDNCSSCLGEGDSSPSSSNLGTLESSSASDTDESNLQFEGKEALNYIPNGSSKNDEVIQKRPNSEQSRGTRLDVFPDTAGACSPSKRLHSNGWPAMSGGLEHQVLYTPLPNQHAPYTVFPPPSISYYPQNAVSWTAGPAEGYIPYSHGNHLLYSNALGYGINGNPQLCVQQGPLQVRNPLVSSGSFPIYHSSKVKLDGQTQSSISYKGLDNILAPKTLVLSSSEGPISGDSKHDDPCKVRTEDSNFSLFHFGGPVERAARCNSFPANHQSGPTLSSKPIEKVEGDPTCGKETKIEEYNLFAASNSMRFSIF